MHALCAAWALGCSWMAVAEYGQVRLAAQGFALTGFRLWAAVILAALDYDVHPDAIAEALTQRRARSGCH